MSNNTDTTAAEVTENVAAVLALPRPTLVSEHHDCCSTTFTSSTESDRTPADMHRDHHNLQHARGRRAERIAEPEAPTLEQQVADAPIGSLIVIDTVAAGTVIKSVRAYGDTWIDIANVHRASRSGAEMLERLSTFRDRIRIVRTDITA